MPKIKQLKQIHGRFDPETPYFDVLDKIEAKLNNLRSKTDENEENLDKYTKKLNKINLHDLQIYATNVDCKLYVTLYQCKIETQAGCVCGVIR